MKYFSTEEEGFRWPIIKKGCSNSERTYYGIIMQRCDKAVEFIKKQGPDCKSSSEIDLIIKNSSLSFQIIDHYADMLNYEIPFIKYFYELSTGFLDNHYHVQNLNFNPTRMITHNGFFRDNEEKEDAYVYTQNEKQTLTEQNLNLDGKSTNGCLIAIYFWMQNTLQNYERHYDRIQDVLSYIGGISSIVLKIVSIINLVINNYVVISDTEEIALNSMQKNYRNPNEIKKPTIFRKANIVILHSKNPYQLGKQYANDSQQESSNCQGIIKNRETNYQKDISKEEKSEQIKNGNLIKNNLDGDNMMDSLYNSRGYLERVNQNYLDGNYCHKGKDTTKRVIKEKKEENDNNPQEKQNLNLCNYLGYLICCGRTNKKIAYYKEFRSKLISEENIIQNYIDIYKSNEYIKNKVINTVE